MRLSANELRRGNWLIVPSGKEEQVISIWNDFQIKTGIIGDKDEDGYVLSHDHKTDYCNGVPITKERLLRCGWKHAKTPDEVWDQIKISYYDEVFWTNGLYFIRCVDEEDNDWQLHFSTDEDTETYLGNYIHFIHELQNIMFSLEKEEVVYGPKIYNDFEDILTDSFDIGTEGFINKRSELTGKIFMSHKDHEYEIKDKKLFFDCGPQIPTNALSDSVYIYDYLDTLAKKLNINLYCGEAENLQSIKADNVLAAYVQYEELKKAITDDGFEVIDEE